MKLRFVGALALTSFLYDPLQIGYKYLYGRLPDFNQYGGGSYALITGATDGIGKGFCEALAAHGFNLVLVSRNAEKLASVASELEKKYQIKTLTHSIDLSQATKAEYESLKRKTDLVDVSMLINNAGEVSYKTTKQLDYENIERIITLNSSSVMHLLNMYLPDLSQRKHRSAVINLSSFLAVRPVPYVSIYSGSKAFNHYVTEGLSEEYRDSIDVLSFQPATVLTKATANEKPSWRSCSVDQSVRGALMDLGKKNCSHGHFNHELMAWAVYWIPNQLRLKIFGSTIVSVIEKRTGQKVS